MIILLSLEIIATIIVAFFTNRPSTYFRITRRSLAYALFSILAYCGIIYFFSVSFAGMDTLFREFVQGIVLSAPLHYLVYIFVIAFCEEYIFRLFLVQKIGIYASAILFMILHWRPGFPYGMFPIVFLFALAQSFLFKKTNSIAVPMLAHAGVTLFLLLYFV